MQPRGKRRREEMNKEKENGKEMALNTFCYHHNSMTLLCYPLHEEW